MVSTYACKRYEVVEEVIGGRLQKVFKNRPKNVNEILTNTVAKYGNRVGFISEERRWSFKEFSKRIDNMALALQKEFKVRKGDRVAVLMGTDLDFPLVFFAVTKLGGVIVPLNTRYKGDELTFEINNSGANVVIVDVEFWETVESYQNAWVPVKYVFVNGGDTPQNTFDFEILLKDRQGAIDEVATTEDDTVMIMYTSGTTGHPKGAMQFHRGIVQACMTIDDLIESDPDKDKTLCVVPMFHSSGIIMSTISSILMGIPCVYRRKFGVKDMLATIEKEKITFAVVVPTMIWLMINHAVFSHYDLSSFRAALSGGAPNSPQIFEGIREKLPLLKVHAGFGMTETHTMDIMLVDEELDQHITTAGKASPLSEVRILDGEGSECLPNVPGELTFRGSKIISSYWKNPSETQRLIVDGWLHTGDVASIDKEGYITIHDRIKDMINRGGEKIFSLEVENVLYQHPKILEAAVRVEHPLK